MLEEFTIGPALPGNERIWLSCQGDIIWMPLVTAVQSDYDFRHFIAKHASADRVGHSVWFLSPLTTSAWLNYFLACCNTFTNNSKRLCFHTITFYTWKPIHLYAWRYCRVPIIPELWHIVNHLWKKSISAIIIAIIIARLLYVRSMYKTVTGNSIL